MEKRVIYILCTTIYIDGFYVHVYNFMPIFGKNKILKTYVEGKKTSAKEKIEVVDDANKTIIFSIFDGEIGESYKSLRATLQTIDKENGGIVKWTYEYEKLSENITAPSPQSFLDFVILVTKDIDDHLVKP